MENPENKTPQPINPEPSVAPPSPSSLPTPEYPTSVSPTPDQPSNVPPAPPSWFASELAASGQGDPNVVASKPKKKGLIIGIIIAAVVAVLGASSALAYNFWYQNPEKVVTDSIINAIKAKTVTYTGSVVIPGDQEVKIEVAGRGEGSATDHSAKIMFKYEGKDITIEGGMLTDSDGNLYFKVKNLDTLVEENETPIGSTPEGKKLLDDIVSKINDEWIKVNADDLKSFSSTMAESQKCFNEVAKKIETDKAVTDELADTYKKHKFIVIDDKLGSQDGSLGYRLSVDRAIAKDFTKDLKNTQVYKTMKDCDVKFSIDEEQLFKDSKDDKTTTTFELWVSRFSHQVTKLSIESKEGEESKGTLVFEPVFNSTIEAVTAPENSITIKQLQEDIQALFESAMGSSAASADAADPEIDYDLDTDTGYDGTYDTDSSADDNSDLFSGNESNAL